jgi:predicted acyltransferase
MNDLVRKSLLFLLLAVLLPAAPVAAAQIPHPVDAIQGHGDVDCLADESVTQKSVLAIHPDGQDSNFLFEEIPVPLMVLAVVGAIGGAAFGHWFGRRTGLWLAAGTMLGVGLWGLAGAVSIVLSHQPLLNFG